MGRREKHQREWEEEGGGGGRRGQEEKEKNGWKDEGPERSQGGNLSPDVIISKDVDMSTKISITEYSGGSLMKVPGRREALVCRHCPVSGGKCTMKSNDNVLLTAQVLLLFLEIALLSGTKWRP